MENVCIICFDDFTEDNPICINPVECMCKFDIHEECWLKWAEINDVILECPICHKYIEDDIKYVEIHEIQPRNSIYLYYILYLIIISLKFMSICAQIIYSIIRFFMLIFF
jgi:hypothetical protein